MCTGCNFQGISMIYQDFVVLSVEHKSHPISQGLSQDHVIYSLESRSGEKVGFDLTIGGCVGEKKYQKQYETVRDHLLPGTRISCRIVYTDRSEYFAMCMSSFAVLQASPYPASINVHGEWIDLPGVIEFYGEANIPILSGQLIKHVDSQKKSQKALKWVNNKSWLFRLFNHLKTG